MKRLVLVSWVIATSSLIQGAWAIESPDAARVGPKDVRLHWQEADPVNIYVSADAKAGTSKATPLAHRRLGGLYDFTGAISGRPYFILENAQTGTLTRVAERVLPLERSSNFRDLGGYRAAGDKHVRWGAIYRSAANPMLTASDFGYLRKLGLRVDVDLRSTDERAFSPDLLARHMGARYLSADYRFSIENSTYTDWSLDLVPQFRLLFNELLRGRRGAVLIHCTGGQDRTGIASALVLSALGVDRSDIVQDYLLSAKYRRPRYELVKADPAQYPGNAFVDYVAGIPDEDLFAEPYLLDSSRKPLLDESFAEIEKRFGSVGAFLEKRLGIGPVQIAQLRARYLE